LLTGGLLCATAAWAQAPMPGFAELEAAGATIGKITVVSRDIFDTTDPEEDYLLFKWANALHIQTRASVIESALLFKSGDPVSVRVLDETERLLRRFRYLNDVQFRPLSVQDGVVDIEVSTRDTWTLNLGIRASRSGGENVSGLQLEEDNLFGTGTYIGFGRTNDVDRSSNEFRIANDHTFGNWISLGYTHTANSDGGGDAVAIVRPFYALDTRWAAGFTALKNSSIEPIYNAGEVVSEYRYRQRRAEVFGGWSAGLIDGWTHRYSLGFSAVEHDYAVEPGRVAPAELQDDEKLVGPFVRYELVEERFAKELNRNIMGRPEFFALGLASTVQLGLASTALGSSKNALVYSGSVSRGFEPGPGQTLMAAARIFGQLAGGGVEQQQLGADTQYYRPQGKRWLFYAAASADVLTEPEANQYLMLGGDNGLRGYPLRYQSGTRRALFTVEERFYTDIYLWRLFRFGGAAFFDTGRAWGGDNTNTSNPGWLSDAGLGLRIVSTRSAFSTVLHIDLAFPLNATAGIDRVQLLVTSKASF
jgi:outer membrane protein assembly factor BamA